MNISLLPAMSALILFSSEQCPPVLTLLSEKSTDTCSPLCHFVLNQLLTISVMKVGRQFYSPEGILQILLFDRALNKVTISGLVLLR